MARQDAGTPEAHLRRADPVLGAVVDEVLRENDGDRPVLPPDPRLPPNPNMPTDRYGSLLRAIVSQNISGTASRSVWFRLLDRFGGRPPTPREVLDDDPGELRAAAGLSRAKTASMRSLAEHILSGELDLERLHDLPDEDVVARLDMVKGIGTWTADMFLMFHLHRPDVLPVGDVGIRRAVEKAYGLPGLPGPAELERIAEPWRPYRTLACMYLWRSAATTPYGQPPGRDPGGR